MKSQTKLMVTLHMANISEWKRYIAHLSTLSFDGVEWRLDALMEWNMEDIQCVVKQFRYHFPKKLLMLTIRTEGEREVLDYTSRVEQVAPFADIIDIEYFTVQNISWIEKIEKITPVILSVHQFECNDQSIAPLLSMLSKVKVSHLKVATCCISSLGVERCLEDTVEAIKEYSQTISTMVMGQKGEITRRMAPSLGEGFVYAGMGTCCLKYGQLSANEIFPYIEAARRKENGKEKENYKN